MLKFSGKLEASCFWGVSRELGSFWKNSLEMLKHEQPCLITHLTWVEICLLFSSVKTENNKMIIWDKWYNNNYSANKNIHCFHSDTSVVCYEILQLRWHTVVILFVLLLALQIRRSLGITTETGLFYCKEEVILFKVVINECSYIVYRWKDEAVTLATVLLYWNIV